MRRFLAGLFQIATARRVVATCLSGTSAEVPWVVRWVLAYVRLSRASPGAGALGPASAGSNRYLWSEDTSDLRHHTSRRTQMPCYSKDSVPDKFHPLGLQALRPAPASRSIETRYH